AVQVDGLCLVRAEVVDHGALPSRGITRRTDQAIYVDVRVRIGADVEPADVGLPDHHLGARGAVKAGDRLAVDAEEWSRIDLHARPELRDLVRGGGGGGNAHACPCRLSAKIVAKMSGRPSPLRSTAFTFA